MNKNKLEYAVFITFAKFIQLLGIYRARKFARILGGFFYCCLPIRKKLVTQNLLRAFPEKSISEIKSLVLKNYISVTTMLFETMCVPKLSKEELQKNLICDKWDLMEEKIKLGKGLILLTAHFGNWEFGAVAVGSHITNAVDVLVKSQRNELVSSWLDSMRMSFGNRVITLGSSVRELIKGTQGGRDDWNCRRPERA